MGRFTAIPGRTRCCDAGYLVLTLLLLLSLLLSSCSSDDSLLGRLPLDREDQIGLLEQLVFILVLVRVLRVDRLRPRVHILRLVLAVLPPPATSCSSSFDGIRSLFMLILHHFLIGRSERTVGRLFVCSLDSYEVIIRFLFDGRARG